MNQEEFDGLVERITTLFRQDFAHDSGDVVRDQLAHNALYNTYMSLLRFDALGEFKPHPFVPEEFSPLLDGLSVESFSPQELLGDMDKRAAAREELVGGLVKKARQDPDEFKNLFLKLYSYANNFYYDARNDVQHGVESPAIAPEDAQHSALTATIAYFLLPDLWRDVSLRLVGKGNYLIGFRPNGQPISKRLKEPPKNIAAIDDAVTKWHRIADHAITFFNFSSLDRIVKDNDAWSGVDIIDGYPIVADARTIAYQLLSFGYNSRERHSPIIHMFPLDSERVKHSKYKEGQSIASITVVDLHDPKKGLEYVIRHTDGTIAAGRLFLDPESGEFAIISSNAVQYARKRPEIQNIDPLSGIGVLAASFGRDMMVYDNREKAYREEGGMQSPSEHEKPEPVITMLPRVKYGYNIKPDRYSSESDRLKELVRRRLSPYHRTYHGRTLPEGQNPSEKQLELNASLPVPLKLGPGETFVRDTWVNGYDLDMVKQFKSKSAAAVLFSAR